MNRGEIYYGPLHFYLFSTRLLKVDANFSVARVFNDAHSVPY